MSVHHDPKLADPPVLNRPDDLSPLSNQRPIPFILPPDFLPLMTPSGEEGKGPFTWLAAELGLKIFDSFSTQELLEFRAKHAFFKPLVDLRLSLLCKYLAHTLGIELNEEWNTLPLMHRLQELIGILHEEAALYQCDQVPPPELCKPEAPEIDPLHLDLFERLRSDIKKMLLEHSKKEEYFLGIFEEAPEIPDLEPVESKHVRLRARMIWEIDHVKEIAAALSASSLRRLVRQRIFLISASLDEDWKNACQLPSATEIRQLEDSALSAWCQKIQQRDPSNTRLNSLNPSAFLNARSNLVIEGDPKWRYLPDIDFSQTRYLQVYSTPLRQLSASLSNCSQLTDIILCKTALSTFPSVLFSCHALRVIIIKEGSLSSMPEIPEGAFPRLEHLNLNENRLETLPATISQLSSLRVALLNHNRFRYIPQGLSSLLNLQFVSLLGNPIKEGCDVPSFTAKVTLLLTAANFGSSGTLAASNGLVHIS